MYNTFTVPHGWGGMLNLQWEPTFDTYDRTYHAVYKCGGQVYKTFCKDRLQMTLTFNVAGRGRKYDRMINGSRVTYNLLTPVQRISVSVAWKFSGGKKWMYKRQERR